MLGIVLKMNFDISKTAHPQTLKVAKYLENNFMKYNKTVFFYGQPVMPIRYILESQPRNAKKDWFIHSHQRQHRKALCLLSKEIL